MTLEYTSAITLVNQKKLLLRVFLFYFAVSYWQHKIQLTVDYALSPLLFVIIMEALSREFRVAWPWELLYADDLVVIAETEDDLIKRLNEWKDNMVNRGMRVNMNKTKVVISG